MRIIANSVVPNQAPFMHLGYISAAGDGAKSLSMASLLLSAIFIGALLRDRLRGSTRKTQQCFLVVVAVISLLAAPSLWWYGHLEQERTKGFIQELTRLHLRKQVESRQISKSQPVTKNEFRETESSKPELGEGRCN